MGSHLECLSLVTHYTLPLLFNQGPSRLTAVILTPDYQPEIVQVWLPHPVDLPTAQGAIGLARGPDRADTYASLIPVWPQPSRRWATFLAIPEWATGSIVICLDLGQYDGRLFACQTIAVIDRFLIMQLAGLWGQDVDIYSPTQPHPVRSDQDITVTQGMCFSIVRRGDQPPPILDIEVLLLCPQSWRDGGPPIVDPGDNLYCAATETGHRLFRIDPARSRFYREELAVFLPCPAQRLVVEPTRPRVDNAAVKGWPCRTVIAAASSAGGPTHLPAHLILVDCRPLMQGWYLTWAEQGRISATTLQDDLGVFAPPGYDLSIEGAPTNAGFFIIRPR